MIPTPALNPGRLGAAAQCSSFASSSGSQIVQNMPSACDSTNSAMFLRTSDSGQPPKINFCRSRTDAVENSPDPCSRRPLRDRTFAGGSIALSMSCPFLERLDFPTGLLVPTYQPRLQVHWVRHVTRLTSSRPGINLKEAQQAQENGCRDQASQQRPMEARSGFHRTVGRCRTGTNRSRLEGRVLSPEFHGGC